ncbi:hypothetical protein ACFYXH_38890 [Streptomyces sp. NPDC002730]
MEWADAVLFGSATRFGNISSQLKQSIDTSAGSGRRASRPTRSTAGSPPL